MALVGTGRVWPGRSDYYDVVLRAYVTYSIYVLPERSSVDFDVRVYDENDNLVAWDLAPDSDAACTVTPRWTGNFRIFVDSARGVGNYTISIQP
ncbi:hypothetical protein ADK57_34585 [Streptomyces sp. MMG1533]|uniref:hypothetical protein n=1 Tax=Streptomyces sp. MMG1533 TaxID=1415546 RepID=UPI0006AECC03|nr:hypothetical protein [Streptomyces sp. MMG1533]KOU59140.1 hypothetical protein ADK57_34585 [Streptomyces sp. MMG1533]